VSECGEFFCRPLFVSLLGSFCLSLFLRLFPVPSVSAVKGRKVITHPLSCFFSDQLPKLRTCLPVQRQAFAKFPALFHFFDVRSVKKMSGQFFAIFVFVYSFAFFAFWCRVTLCSEPVRRRPLKDGPGPLCRQESPSLPPFAVYVRVSLVPSSLSLASSGGSGFLSFRSPENQVKPQRSFRGPFLFPLFRFLLRPLFRPNFRQTRFGLLVLFCLSCFVTRFQVLPWLRKFVLLFLFSSLIEPPLTLLPQPPLRCVA